MNRSLEWLGGTAGAMAWLLLAAPSAPADPPDMAVIRPDVETGFANAGWKYDRYEDLPSLDARKTMTVAERAKLMLRSRPKPGDLEKTGHDSSCPRPTGVLPDCPQRVVLTPVPFFDE